jgi:hypothetical protein
MATLARPGSRRKRVANASRDRHNRRSCR